MLVEKIWGPVDQNSVFQNPALGLLTLAASFYEDLKVAFCGKLAMLHHNGARVGRLVGICIVSSLALIWPSRHGKVERKNHMAYWPAQLPFGNEAVAAPASQFYTANNSQNSYLIAKE